MHRMTEIKKRDVSKFVPILKLKYQYGAQAYNIMQLGKN